MRQKHQKLQGKSNLARLLAIENIFLTHDPKATTASFDLRRRIVTLPVLEDMTGPIYDGFICHEIAHALFTPPKEYMQLAEDTHPVVANVCEDARIEKLIKRKYPGCVRDFYDMYKNFSSPERDFFKLEGLDLNTLTLVDKLNLKFKIGMFVDVPFTQEEKYFINLLANQETFEDVEKAAKELMKWMKDNNQVIEETVTKVGFTFVVDEDGEPSDGDSKIVADASKFKELGIIDKNLQKAIKNIHRKRNANDVIFGDIYKYADYARHIVDERKSYSETKNQSEYWSFLRSVTPTINMMVAQFNRRKAAYEYQRIKTSKTGMINTKKISSYKLTDDVFKRNEEIPDSKNHGFVMLIDWSASMSTHISSTVKQLLLLMEFCRKVQIPFEVYGFTNSQASSMYSSPQPRTLFAHTNGKLFLLFKSIMKTEQFRKRSEWIYDCVTDGRPNTIHEMRSTPLNFTGFLSEYVIRDFQKRWNTQKTSVILLSDGCPTDGIISDRGGINEDTTDVIMRDPNTFKNYTIKGNQGAYHTIFEYIKDACNVWKTIGFFLTNKLSDDDIQLIAPGFDENRHHEAIDKFQKENVYQFPETNGFNKYFAINVNNFPIAENGSFTIDRRNSMVFLKNFIEEIS